MPDLRSKMTDFRSERFKKLVLGLRGLILDLIQGSRPNYRLGRPDLGLIDQVESPEGLILGLKGQILGLKGQVWGLKRPDLELRGLN